MANKITFLSAFFVLLMVGACKKSNSGSSNTPNPLTGTWNFVDLSSNGNLTATESGLISAKLIDITDFTTIDNSGTITFTADSMAGSGIGYTIDTTYTTYTYIEGSAGDTVTTPYTTTISPTSSSTSYQLIGSDSIYFGSGTPFAVSLYAGDTIKIEGAHFSISGNTLTLTSTIDQAGNVTYVTAYTSAIGHADQKHDYTE